MNGKSPFDLVKAEKPTSLRSPVTKSPRQLQNKTQRVALTLLQKEERNAIRGRLESLLQQQFLRKYGSKNPSSQINTTIRNKIKEFIESYDDIRKAETDICLLEKQISETVSIMKTTIMKANSARVESSKQTKVPSLTNLSSSNGNTTTNTTNGTTTTNIEANQWPVLNAIMIVEAEEKQKKQAEIEYQKKLKYQDELTKQIELNKELKLKEIQQKNNDLIKIQKTLNNYELEQLNNKKKKEELYRYERELREKQIEENKKQKEYEKKQRIAQEKGEMLRAKQMAEQEENEKQLLKLKQKEEQDLLKLENERNKAIKNELLKERQNYEKKLNADYEKKLIKEEEDRNRQFQARMDTLATFSKSYENRIEKRLLQQKEEEEKLLLQNLKDNDNKRAEKERMEIEKRKIISLENNKYNINMIEKKKNDKEKEKMDAILRRQAIEKEALLLKMKEKEENEKKRLQMLELKHMLDDQVALRHKDEKDHMVLSNIEATINKSITKKLSEDPQLLHKVAEVVHRPPMQSSRSDKSGAMHTGRKTGNNIFF